MRANKMYMYVCVSAKLTKYGNNVVRKKYFLAFNNRHN